MQIPKAIAEVTMAADAVFNAVLKLQRADPTDPDAWAAAVRVVKAALHDLAEAMGRLLGCLPEDAPQGPVRDLSKAAEAMRVAADRLCLPHGREDERDGRNARDEAMQTLRMARYHLDLSAMAIGLQPSPEELWRIEERKRRP